MTTTCEGKLIFGIYPGGSAGGDSGLLSGPADDPNEIIACLDELQGRSRPFVVRCYDSFQDQDSPFLTNPCAPVEYLRYAIPESRPLELVLQFRSATGDVPGYLEFIRTKIAQHHSYLYAVQITEEANFVDGPNVIDGPYPNVRRALVEGVIAAKELLRTLRASHVRVGFNATPTFGPAAEFWSGLNDIGSDYFLQALDYVGLDFFPDVFRPLPSDGQAGDLVSSVTGVLETLRRTWLAAARISEWVPIHITEHGWSTGATRSWTRQAEVLETVIRTINDLRCRLNIERYTLFALRDVDFASVEDNAFRCFGITTADYRPKLAFGAFRDLIQNYGALA